jgi:hypothetical protein
MSPNFAKLSQALKFQKKNRAHALSRFTSPFDTLYTFGSFCEYMGHTMGHTSSIINDHELKLCLSPSGDVRRVT